ncbi:MAG TPA: hypothetical protein PKC20_05890, partial [Burkholderiaceae bacterium]|nr:hypothetical protein [Burkholderiaceae bacterium]
MDAMNALGVLREADVPMVLIHDESGHFEGIVFLANLMAATLRVRARHAGRGHFALVLRSDGSPECEERKRTFRTEATRAGIPAFDEMTNVADALSAVAAYERFVARRG